MNALNFQFPPHPKTGHVRGRTDDFEYKICFHCYDKVDRGVKTLHEVLNETQPGIIAKEFKNCWHIDD